MVNEASFDEIEGPLSLNTKSLTCMFLPLLFSIMTLVEYNKYSHILISY